MARVKANTARDKLRHRRGRSFVLIGIVLSWVWGSGAQAQSPSASQVKAQQTIAIPRGVPRAAAQFQRQLRRLAQWVAAQGGTLSAKAVRVTDGAVLAEHAAHQAQNPASNMKLLTAALALEVLGPQHRFETGLYGAKVQGHVMSLVLRGNGDPTLTEASLWRLSNAAAQMGLTDVETLLVDQSRFDAQFVPPAFEQQPNEWAAFRAPVSALAVDRNTVTLNVIPTRTHAPARVWVQPSGAVQMHGVVATGKAGSGERVAWTLRPPVVADAATQAPKPLVSELGGSIAQDRKRTRFRRRLEDPRLVPGWVLAHQLQRQGVRVGSVALGGEEVRQRITYHSSPPLSEIVKSLGKNSDNFTAEMVFKSLANAAKDANGGGASFARAAQATDEWLRARGLGEREFRVTNGSGLFDANRLSAHALVTILSHAFTSHNVRHEFLAHLAIGGVDGTLHYRFRKSDAKGRIRAKTGTLNAAITLSGYVLGEDSAESPIAFSLMVNGIRGRHAEIRGRIDRCVQALL